MAESREKILAQLTGDLTLVTIPGNRGDDLILAGARRLMNSLTYRELRHSEIGQATGGTGVLIGSGSWSQTYDLCTWLLPRMEAVFQRVVVLPSSYEVAHAPVRDALSRSKAFCFARERVSYSAMRRLRRCQLALGTSFFFDFDPYRRDGEGTLNAFRTDGDSTLAEFPPGNIDISRAYADFKRWLGLIASYAVVRTDRAHVMVAAAMLGKQVEYLPCRYHKVEAIAEYALADFPNVRRIDHP
jgi:hypothetical protein